MSFIPLAVQLLPLIPGLIQSTLQIVNIVKADPQTPADTKASLDELSAKLDAAMEHVRLAPLPGA